MCEAKVPVWLYPYDILAVSERAGIIEAVKVRADKARRCRFLIANTKLRTPNTAGLNLAGLAEAQLPRVHDPLLLLRRLLRP